MTSFLKTVFICVFSTSCLLLCSCSYEGDIHPMLNELGKVIRGDKDSTPQASAEQTVFGFNDALEWTSCTPKVTQVCDDSFGPGDAFADRCKEGGGIAYFCDCHRYLCSQRVEKRDTSVDSSQHTWEVPDPDPFVPVPQEELPAEFVGFNSQGESETCAIPTWNGVCTEIYGPDEVFRDRCWSAGYQAFVCGCHHYLCESKVSVGERAEPLYYRE